MLLLLVQVLSWLHSRGLALGGFSPGQLLLGGPAGAWLTLLAAPVAATATAGALLPCGSDAARPSQGSSGGLVQEGGAGPRGDPGPRGDLLPPLSTAVSRQLGWCGTSPPPLGLLQAAWCAGVLPNLDYLLWLNTLAGERGPCRVLLEEEKAQGRRGCCGMQTVLHVVCVVCLFEPPAVWVHTIVWKHPHPAYGIHSSSYRTLPVTHASLPATPPPPMTQSCPACPHPRGAGRVMGERCAAPLVPWVHDLLTCPAAGEGEGPGDDRGEN
jgi:hypothetical protein